jgi:hypothetical protein
LKHTDHVHQRGGPLDVVALRLNEDGPEVVILREPENLVGADFFQQLGTLDKSTEERHVLDGVMNKFLREKISNSTLVALGIQVGRCFDSRRW